MHLIELYLESSRAASLNLAREMRVLSCKQPYYSSVAALEATNRVVSAPYCRPEVCCAHQHCHNMSSSLNRTAGPWPIFRCL